MAEAKKNITKQAKKHKRLKSYHRKKKKPTNSTTDNTDEITALEVNLAKKDDKIIVLQNNQVVLEERIAELEVEIKATKSE